MKYCIKCGLPETYPKIKIDAEGVCCFCRFYEAHQAQLDDYDSLHRQFLSEIEKAKEKARENGSPYDCIVGLSGGKDGAYLICQLKKVYGMRVLAYTFDNGFSTDFGRQNCEKLKRAMDIDHIYISMKDSELCKFLPGRPEGYPEFLQHLLSFYALPQPSAGFPLRDSSDRQWKNQKPDLPERLRNERTGAL